MDLSLIMHQCRRWRINTFSNLNGRVSKKAELQKHLFILIPCIVPVVENQDIPCAMTRSNSLKPSGDVTLGTQETANAGMWINKQFAGGTQWEEQHL